MTTTPRQITRRSELLAMLRESPSTRRACDIYAEDGSSERVRYVLDSAGMDRGALRIAEIAPGSAADQLCTAIMQADAMTDRDAWARLPLRYQVFGSSYLLPEHPDAPTAPGGLALAQRAFDDFTADMLARQTKPSFWRRLFKQGRG
jgi:hypothetical protein